MALNDKEIFVKKYLPFALLTQQKTGISAIAILAQAAVESAWGKIAPGNMFFGVKDTDGINGNEQLITTTEYHTTIGVKYPQVISIVPVVMNGKKMFRYRVKDYFRKFETPEESFTHHASFFLKNKRYAKALLVKSDPVEFVKAIAVAGYATAPNYAATLVSVVNSIKKIVEQK